MPHNKMPHDPKDSALEQGQDLQNQDQLLSEQSGCFSEWKDQGAEARKVGFDTIRPKDEIPSPSVMIVTIPIGEYLCRTNVRHWKNSIANE